MSTSVVTISQSQPLASALPDMVEVGPTTSPERRPHPSLDALVAKLELPESLDAARRRLCPEPVEPVDGLYRACGARALYVKGLLSEEECAALLSALLSDAPLETARTSSNYRNCQRAELYSDRLAALLYARLQSVFTDLVGEIHVEPSGRIQHRAGEEPAEAPPELYLGYCLDGDWSPKGLNECLRFCRYEDGGFFRVHCDGSYVRTEDERSLYTCMLYLDGGFGGGKTRFLPIDYEAPREALLRPAPPSAVLAEVAPEPGSCLLFFHKGLLHEGEDITGPLPKHILRTDVLFQRRPGSRAPRTEAQAEAATLLRQAQEAEERGECDQAVAFYRRAFRLDPELERIT